MKTIQLDQAIKLPTINEKKRVNIDRLDMKYRSKDKSPQPINLFNEQSELHMERDYIGWENYNNYKYKSYKKNEVRFLNKILFQSRNKTITNPLNVYLSKGKREFSLSHENPKNIISSEDLKPKKETLPKIKSHGTILAEKIQDWLTEKPKKPVKQSEASRGKKSKVFTSTDDEVLENNRSIRTVLSKILKEQKPCKGLRIKSKEDFNKFLIQENPELKMPSNKDKEELKMSVSTLKSIFDSNIKSFSDELLSRILYINGVEGAFDGNNGITVDDNAQVNWKIFSKIKFHVIEKKSSILESLTFICNVISFAKFSFSILKMSKKSQ